MKSINELVEKLKLKDYFSTESLDKLTSKETSEKAEKVSTLRDLQELFDELNLPELSDLVLFDPNPAPDNAEFEWGRKPTGDDLIQQPFGQELDKDGLTALVKKVENRRSALMLLDDKSVSNSTSIGAGAVAGAATGAAVVLVTVGAAPIVATGVVVGAAAGAVGALISIALDD
jgi:hypothetical protein